MEAANVDNVEVAATEHNERPEHVAVISEKENPNLQAAGNASSDMTPAIASEFFSFLFLPVCTVLCFCILSF